MSHIPEPMKSEYPEHMKQALVVEKSQVIAEFLEWVAETHDAELCVTESQFDYRHLMIPVDDLLAEFFEIDLDRIEDEKREMLRQLAELNGGESQP